MTSVLPYTGVFFDEDNFSVMDFFRQLDNISVSPGSGQPTVRVSVVLCSSLIFVYADSLCPVDHP